MALTAGQRLGVYEIVSAIGAGGMGEVYRARDTKLQRDVAIKVLPESLATDRDRLARFEREAQLLAALNHPHIAAIYGVDAVADTPFLVLELVEGDTLADRIARGGALSQSEALAIAHQLADALQAAHDKGIIHRDLKPANIALTGDGHVKVLDFGLAKAIEGSPAGQSGVPAATLSPTLSVAMTQAGFILGTAAYMSPEQAKGRPADKRSDVWAFGCVLFEMLTGKRAFEGEDVSDTLAGILRGEPDWKALPRSTPAHVREVITGCLAKDRRQRLADIAVVSYLLGDSRRSRSTPDAGVSRRLMLAFAAAAVVLMAAAAGATWWLLRTPTVAVLPTQFEIVPPMDALLSATNTDRLLALSPDGRKIVYASNQGALTIRHMDQLAVQRIDGVAGARFPFWSYDGKWIGYSAANLDLRKVSVDGGAPVSLVPSGTPPRGASWGPDDTIIFATADTSSGLLSIPSAGGVAPKVLTKPAPAKGEQDHVLPHHLPGGKGVLFTITSAASPDDLQVAVLDLRTGTYTPLLRGASHAEYVEPGYLVFAGGGALRAVRFDLDTLTVTGDAVPVLDQVAILPNGTAQYATAKSGALVYLRGSGFSAIRTLVWVDRATGHQTPVPDITPRAYQYPRLSPDDSCVALTIDDQQRDIWLYTFATRTTRQITFSSGADQQATWYPGGDRILFSSTRNGPANLYAQRIDGTGTAERVTDSSSSQISTTMTPDGAFAVVLEQHNTTGNDLMLLRLSPGAGADAEKKAALVKSEPLIMSMTTEAHPEISPDGRYLAYMSNESGQPQIIVKPFPDLNGEWRITVDGGLRPAWSRTGEELFYGSPTGAIMAVPVQLSPTFSFGTPKKVFDWPTLSIPGLARTFDVSRDGRRFLMIKEGSAGVESRTSAISVVLNWMEELKAKLPPRQ
jgi:eukaryotic-like serine/threonine-protein kinase